MKEHGVQVPLEDIASKDQKQDVEICCLVISELDQAVIDQESVILSELESPISVSS